jgi:hypothetical protein
MKIRTERLENGNLRVHLPVTLRCRGGRWQIVSGEVPPTLTAMRLRESITLNWDEQERELLGE